MADAELHYVAPELLTGENADVRSDVFTMGVLAYEMATATLPFAAPRCRRCSARCCAAARRIRARASRRFRMAPPKAILASLSAVRRTSGRRRARLSSARLIAAR